MLLEGYFIAFFSQMACGAHKGTITVLENKAMKMAHVVQQLWLLFRGTSGFADIWLSQAQSKSRFWKTRADCTWNQNDNGGRK